MQVLDLLGGAVQSACNQVDGCSAYAFGFAGSGCGGTAGFTLASVCAGFTALCGCGIIIAGGNAASTGIAGFTLIAVRAVFTVLCGGGRGAAIAGGVIAIAGSVVLAAGSIISGLAVIVTAVDTAGAGIGTAGGRTAGTGYICLLYTSDAADDR